MQGELWCNYVCLQLTHNTSQRNWSIYNSQGYSYHLPYKVDWRWLSPNPLVIIYWPVLRDLWRFILFGVYGYSVQHKCCLDHRPCQEAWKVHSGQCLTRELVSSFCIVWRWSRSWSFDVQSWLSLSGDMLVKTMELSVQDICAFAVYSTIFGLGSNTPKVLRS